MYQKTIGLCIFYGKHKDSKCNIFFWLIFSVYNDQPKDQKSLILSIIFEETISKKIFIRKKWVFLVMKLLKTGDIGSRRK